MGRETGGDDEIGDAGGYDWLGDLIGGPVIVDAGGEDGGGGGDGTTVGAMGFPAGPDPCLTVRVMLPTVRSSFAATVAACSVA